MGQKTHPSDSRWHHRDPQVSLVRSYWALFAELLVEDYKIRKFLDRRLNRTSFAAVADMVIERTREELTVILKTARPGLVIGPKGVEIEKLQRDLQAITGRKVAVKIVEIRNLDCNAWLLAESISEQLKKRANYRRLLKQRCEGAMQNGAKGVRIRVSGRLGGAEMSRVFATRLGSIPLSTLQANVDYASIHCRTTYGVLGIKVWIYCWACSKTAWMKLNQVLPVAGLVPGAVAERTE